MLNHFNNDQNDPNIQGSEAWKIARASRIGGSEISIILDLNPWRTPYDLWCEKINLKQPEDISKKPHVIRGVLSEPIAREKFNRERNKQFQPKVWPIIEGCLGASDDGFDATSNELIEIKTMGEQAHEDAKSGFFPDYYRAQVIWNLGISGASKAYFISCRPENDYELAVIEVEPDPKYFEEMKAKALQFWELVTLKIAPELTDKDIVDMSEDTFFRETAKSYAVISKQLKELEKEAEEAKSLLISRMAGHPSVKCPELRLTRYTRQGNISYSDVPELKGVNLEPYRKAPSIGFKVTLS